MVRAHEVQSDGYRRHFEPAIISRRNQLLLQRQAQGGGQGQAAGGQDDSTSSSSDLVETFPPVITVFSAPNYCDKYDNKAALLHIGEWIWCVGMHG